MSTNTAAYSYAVVARDIPIGGRTYQLEPDADERKAIAATLEIPEVRAVTGQIRVSPAGGQAYAVRGSVAATVVQTCVVTLEPVVQEILEEVDLVLMRAEDARPGGKRRDEFVDALETEGPEVFHNGRIDLGTILTEHLALGLDPYPHAPGVEFEGHVEDDRRLGSPFAALAAMKTGEN